MQLMLSQMKTTVTKNEIQKIKLSGKGSKVNQPLENVEYDWRGDKDILEEGSVRGGLLLAFSSQLYLADFRSSSLSFRRVHRESLLYSSTQSLPTVTSQQNCLQLCNHVPLSWQFVAQALVYIRNLILRQYLVEKLYNSRLQIMNHDLQEPLVFFQMGEKVVEVSCLSLSVRQ